MSLLMSIFDLIYKIIGLYLSGLQWVFGGIHAGPWRAVDFILLLCVCRVSLHLHLPPCGLFAWIWSTGLIGLIGLKGLLRLVFLR